MIDHYGDICCHGLEWFSCGCDDPGFGDDIDGAADTEHYEHYVEWPVGPPHEFSPHEFSPKRVIAAAAICNACGHQRDRAIHDQTYWRRQGIELSPATKFVEWANERR